MSQTKVQLIKDGALAEDSIVHDGDTNTKIRFSGADTITAETAGSERLRVDSSGLVGIGTSTPSSFNSDGRNLVVGTGSGGQGLSIYSANNNYGNIYFADGTSAGSYNAGGILYNHDSNFMRFDTVAAERMRIDSSGRLLAGRTNNISVGGDPSDHCFEQLTDNGYALTVHSNQANQRGIGIFYPSGQTPEAAFAFQIASSFKTIIRSDGDLENANNSYGGISDVSLKENIVDANSQWDDIKNIKIRNYNFKVSTGQPTHKQIGVIAQELETVCPNLVDVTRETGKKNVAYSVLYVKAVKALQEAMARIETLESDVAALKAA